MEGPKHNQVLNSILMTRLYALLQTVEESSGKKFALQRGCTIIEEKHKRDIIFPLEIPVVGVKAKELKKTLKAIAHAPEHEILFYSFFLQVIEWIIQSTEK